jgi:hypothetical protein
VTEAEAILWAEARVQPARFVVLGEAPSPRWTGDRSALLASRPFRRIAELIYPREPDREVAWARYLAETDRANVLQRVQPSGPWRPAVQEVAWANAAEVRRHAGNRRIFAVGRRAAWALGCSDGEWGTIDGSVVLLPHPSGLDRWWNDPGELSQLRGKMLALAIDQ